MLLASHRNVFMSVFSALALFAIVVRGVVPAGYMIKAPDSGGAFIEVELCRGDGSPASKVRIDLGKTQTGDHRAPSEEHGDASKAPCAFAAVSSFTPVADYGSLIRPAPVVIQTRAISTEIRPGRGLASPPPPATGPPTFI